MAYEDTESVDQIQPGNDAEVVEDSSAENTPEMETEASPAPERNDSAEREQLIALREQLARQEERNRYLEHTARLLEEDRRRYSQATQPKGNELPDDLAELDKTLDPILSRRLQGVAQPLVETVTRLYDEQDASRFEMYLMRNHPEVFETDGGLDKVFQEVDAVRRAAAQNYNQWLSRADAFAYAQGVGKIQETAKQRKTRKAGQASAEAKRQAQVAATRSGEISNERPRNFGNDIQAIRAKANRGERLTDAERAKYRDALANVTF